MKSRFSKYSKHFEKGPKRKVFEYFGMIKTSIFFIFSCREINSLFSGTRTKIFGSKISKVMIVFKFRPKFKFLNLDPKIFVLVPENGEFISLQENIKKYLF